MELGLKALSKIISDKVKANLSIGMGLRLMGCGIMGFVRNSRMASNLSQKLKIFWTGFRR